VGASRRRIVRRAGAGLATLLGAGLIIGATASVGLAATAGGSGSGAAGSPAATPAATHHAKHHAQKAQLKHKLALQLKQKSLHAAALPAAAVKPLSVSPSTGLKNNQTVTVSAPAGTFPNNDPALVIIECNPDSSIPQDGSGCTPAKFLASGANATGGVDAMSFTVKEGKIGSNAKAVCPPTAAQKSAGFKHCVLTISQPSPTGIHAAKDLVFASETTTSGGGGGTKSGSGGSTGSTSSGGSTSSSSGSTQVQGTHSTAGTTSGLPSTGAPYDVALLLAAGCLVVGFAMVRFAPTVKPDRSGSASTTTSSPSRT
jgi:hypothetical protein